MQKFIIFTILIILLFPWQSAMGVHYAGDRIGYILLQVEDNGEAWYVYPPTGNRYYMGRPKDAFEMMRKFALGAKHELIANTTIFPDRLSGLILLDVEANGEAYYIYPKDLRKYYLGRPADAFRIMRELGQGISNEGLSNIPIGDIDHMEAELPESNKILLDVPFTAQAPYGAWSDQRQQDGCEESSALMAMKWASGGSLSKDEALENILGVSDFLLAKYGEYRDISSADAIKWIYNDYYDYQNVALIKNIEIIDIIAELKKGNLVITPMNGQIMHNPYYSSPGPPRHMIVIRGYDPARQVFITNDPGTRNGELYEYDPQVLYEAIRDYPTGYHELITNIEKNMIVVWKD